MTDEQRELLNRVNSYAEKQLGDIDPQKVLVSMQLDKLKPILETIAKEKGITLEEMFIMYMDLQSEAACASEAKLKESLNDINEGEGMPLLFR